MNTNIFNKIDEVKKWKGQTTVNYMTFIVREERVNIDPIVNTCNNVINTEQFKTGKVLFTRMRSNPR